MSDEKPVVGRVVQLSNEPHRRTSHTGVRLNADGRIRGTNTTLWVDMVREFHEKYGVPIASHLHIPSAGLRRLRERLIDEEYLELDHAHAKEDFPLMADAIADLIYVLIGTALCYGIPLDEVFAEVHRSNMTKEGTRREDGKILKGKSFEPPRIKEILERYGS